MAIRVFISVLVCGVGLQSCSRSVGKDEYVKYVEDKNNGFTKEHKIEHWHYRVQFKPASYIYLHEARNALNKEQYITRKSQLEGWCFFNIYVRHDSLKQYAPVRLISSDIQSYNDNLSYYLTQNKHNFILYADTIAYYPTVYNYENDYNLSPEDVFVVGFQVPGKLKNECENLILQYDDELLRNGIIRFVFKQKDLQKEPVLTFN